MRILLLTQFFQPEPMFKGLPLAQALRDRGHQVEVLTSFPNYPGGIIYDGYRLAAWQRESMNGVDVIRLPLFPSHNRGSLRRMLNYLSFGLTTGVLGLWLVKKPDVIYVYNLVTLGTTWRLLRFRHRCRVVLDVQDLWPESVASSGMLKWSAAMRFLSWWCRREYRSVDRLIALSPGFKRNLVARGIEPSKVQVIYNWCDESAITVSTPNAEAAHNLGFSGRFNIVFAGTMGIAQALDTIIDAACIIESECPDVLFTFVGGGIEVERLKRRAELLANVQVLAAKPQSEIGVVLSNADVLLVHLKNDPIFEITIPSKIQAYMYVGKPILCGVRGDAADLIDQSGAGISFDPQDVDSLVNAIRLMRNMSSDRLSRMGLAGSKFYSERLAFQTGVDQIESILEAAVDRPQ